MKKYLRVLFVVLFVFSFISFNNVSAAPAPADTLVLGTANFSYESMDPIFWESMWSFAFCDVLVGTDDNGNNIPAIATKWSIGPDGKEWTFKIRQGVKFHNGDPLTAEDVAFSIKRFGSKESTNPWSGYIGAALVSCDAKDKTTVVFKANKVEPALIVPFSMTRILPKNYIEKNGVEFFRKNPIGSGPYKLTKFVSTKSCEFERNEQYWGKKAYFKKILDLLVPEESTRIAMLKRGEIDILGGLSYDNIVALQKEGFQTRPAGLATVSTLSFVGTWLPNYKGPTSDIRVLKALSYAINRDEICKTFYKGLAKPGGAWSYDTHGWGYDPKWKADPYDPAKAKALLKEAGYPDKFSTPEVVINVVTGGTTPDYMQLIAGYWEAVGVKAVVKTMEAGPWAGMFFARIKDEKAPNAGGVFPWVWPGVFNNVYHSANMFTSVGIHGTANDAKADAMYKTVTSEINPVKAKKLWTEFLAYGNSLYINVPLVMADSLAVVSSKVGKYDKATSILGYDGLAGIHPAK